MLSGEDNDSDRLSKGFKKLQNDSTFLASPSEFTGAVRADFILMDAKVIPHIAHLVDECLESEDISRIDGDRFNSCQVIYSQFGLAIHQNDHQARRRFVEWAQNEIAVVPDFHKRILFSDEAHFWLNGYVNKQNCCIWIEANPQVYVETPLHPEKLTVWCALWAGGILLQKR
ncbi:hypothetical protein TNCV_2396731 [Trichonephila clavipes]|uniref:Transposase n=1 Tax=Trichonephila clavipes TaxID=2585209 RepID=A0A8X6SV99_TRICX|nr:hypothetical protein TNCV_2396731 [Trichonephila clavipes]